MNTANDAATASATDAANSAAPPAPKSLCANCGGELLGSHCHLCGQPVKGMIRPLSSMLSDVADTILNIDSRIFRTLIPLYFRPGYLSNEYFAGHRVRYVTPFRLYFFLSIAAFLLMQASLDSFDFPKDIVDAGDKISAATTAQQVQERRDAALADLDKAKSDLPGVAAKDIDQDAEAIRKQADKRLQYLKSVDEANAKGVIPPPDREVEGHGMFINGKLWDPQTNPIRIRWLPQFVNARLEQTSEHIADNLPRIRKNPKPFLLGAFGLLPQVLFVLMPLFALLLKSFYLFKRRLYMEHLIVALHSHSFVFVSLLLLTLAGLARGWAHTTATWLIAPLGWLIFVMAWWLPIYLFLMQKKVYKQGWFFTTLKFGAIGICYTVMISLGVAAAFVISLATT